MMTRIVYTKVTYSIKYSLGMTEAQREAGRKARPTMEFVKEGDVYKCIGTLAPGLPERVQVFHLDQEQDEIAAGGRKVKVYRTKIRFSI